MTDHGSARHSRYSPSQTERFFRCPGSVALCATAPPRPRGKDEEQGNIAHALLEWALRLGVHTVANVWAGHELFHGELPDEDICRSVQDCMDYIHEITESHPDAVVYSEAYVNPPVSSAPGEAGGMCDVAIWLPRMKHLYVIDYKHGIGNPVFAKDNSQLLSYTAGFVFGGIIPLEDIQGITATIVQPRTFHPKGLVDAVPVSLAALQDYMLELDIKITRTQSPDAPLIPGYQQCRYCDAMTTCPALENTALAVTGKGSLRELATSGMLPEVKSIPIDRLAYIIQTGPVLTKWLKECYNHAHALAKEGLYVPGRKVVHTQAFRKWHGEPIDIAAQLIRLTGLTLNEVMPRTLVNVTDMEKVVVKAHKAKAKGRKAKAAAAERAKQALAMLTLKQQSGNTSLVAESDPRPAVNPGEDFATVNVTPATGEKP